MNKTRSQKPSKSLTTAIQPLAKPRDIALRLGVTPRFVCNMADAGKIPCVRFGKNSRRFNMEAVERALGL